ncbi:hypothetical protein [Actinomycetospora aeridis]|uniref:ANTAR domain-containing protein n=1 Tax=Actinomycetospora aeridis TaxID=3129231 RepID=A0ABU8N183_9PSEU
MPAIATTDPGQQPAPLRPADEHDQLVTVLAYRIHSAGASWAAAHQAAVEIAEHVGQVIREVRAERSGE